MVARMISSGSLAAFSASATAALPSLRAPATLAQTERVNAKNAPAPAGAQRPTVAGTSGQVLPRGSLLDLRV